MSATLSFAVAVYAIAAFAVTGLGALAWRRSGQARHGLLTLAFASSAAAGALAVWWIFTRDDVETLLTLVLALGAGGLLTLYFAAVKR